MAPQNQPAPTFQFAHEHALFANATAKSVALTYFSDTFTAWPSFLNRAVELRPPADIAANSLPAAARAEGYLWALRGNQDTWA